MKLSFAIFTLVSSQEKAQGIQDDVSNEAVRESWDAGLASYYSLAELARRFFQAKDEQYQHDFDVRKYFRYGCHCFISSGKTMIERGHGRPVDALDNKCKAYKDCLRCARYKHGEKCSPLLKLHGWMNSKVGPISLEDAGTCERDLFECDLQLVAGIFAERKSLSEDYHHSDSTIGFNREDKDTFCPSNAGFPSEHQCCGGYDAPWRWINLDNNKCCFNGESGVVVDKNDQC